MSSEDERFTEDWLDAALRKYGEAEPRPGLEGRVLANLRAVSERAGERATWRPMLAALATMLAIGAGLFLARRGTVMTPVANLSPAPAAAGKTPTLANQGRKQVRRRSVARNNAPRPGQFPSQYPLSEQERLLAAYVQQFPREAVLMARVQTEARKEEELERSQTDTQNSEEDNN